MEKIPITSDGKLKVEDELKNLKTIERPRIINSIAEARAHGDLSENAQYHAAKDRQGMIEARISELESKIGLADVIDISNLSSDRIQFGAIVTIVDEETDTESTYQLVGADESDVNKGLLSISSPLARALIGKKNGDAIEIDTPGGRRNYEILSITYN